MPLNISNPDDRKKVAEALVAFLRASADIKDADTTENPFGDIGPSPALLNLQNDMPNISHAEIDAWEKQIVGATQNIHKFNGFLRMIKGAVDVLKIGIPAL